MYRPETEIEKEVENKLNKPPDVGCTKLQLN
jgi:hypothetical protein